MRLDHGANVNHVDIDGLSALYVACDCGHLSCASILLDHSANVNHLDNDGRSALYGACGVGNYECASLLIEKGADVNQVNNTGQNALQISMQYGHNRIVFHLLENGAEVTEVIKRVAVTGNNIKGLALLLRAAGLEHMNVNNSGGKLLRLARHLNYSDIESFLVENRASDDGTPWEDWEKVL